MRELTPRQIVSHLDRYIIGQEEAKRAVAIACRNRWRRLQLDPEDRKDVYPKNIMMIGPTGVGKTEIARRLSSLIGAPFVKVEASKYTEVGYVGRDVESMVRDLVEVAVNMVKEEARKKVQDEARRRAQERLFEILFPDHATMEEEKKQRLLHTLMRKIEAGELDDREVEISVEESGIPTVEIFSAAGMEQMGVDMKEIFDKILPRRRKYTTVKVPQALRMLEEEETNNLIDEDSITAEAIERTENTGIIFIDEIDKITTTGRGSGPDVSREGVQRDLLPIVEGSTVNTRRGQVRTDHILFIAAGAFSSSTPSDLIPELQGRFPVRVELHPLGKAEFERILTEPENSIIRQYQLLMKTEGINLRFTESAIKEIALMADRANADMVDIGARRLHTVMEKLMEEISFDAPEMEGKEVIVDADYVKKRLSGIMEDDSVAKYIL